MNDQCSFSKFLYRTEYASKRTKKHFHYIDALESYRCFSGSKCMQSSPWLTFHSTIFDDIRQQTHTQRQKRIRSHNIYIVGKQVYAMPAEILK